MNIVHCTLLSLLCCMPLGTYGTQAATACPCSRTPQGCECSKNSTDQNKSACCCVEELGECKCATQTCCTPKTRSTRVDVSAGELIDKITILEIKATRISDSQKLRNVLTELNTLTMAFNILLQDNLEYVTDILQLKSELHTINEELWDIENDIRRKEALQEFDEDFIRTSRCVYLKNDARIAAKTRINILLNSHIVEEKQYALY